MIPDKTLRQAMKQFLSTNAIIVDRPMGSSHPRYRDLVYPLDCGYLENAMSSDCGGIDIWQGSSMRMVND